MVVAVVRHIPAVGPPPLTAHGHHDGGPPTAGGGPGGVGGGGTGETEGMVWQRLHLE